MSDRELHCPFCTKSLGHTDQDTLDDDGAYRYCNYCEEIMQIRTVGNK